jgi:hypothetical protein
MAAGDPPVVRNAALGRYGVYDDKGRKVNVIKWDGAQGLPMKWRTNGWEVRPDDGAPLWTPVPREVSPAQFRLGLRAAGRYQQFVSFVQGLPEPARDEVEYATVIRRKSPLIQLAQLQFKLTDDEVDDLFRLMASFDN